MPASSGTSNDMPPNRAHGPSVNQMRRAYPSFPTRDVGERQCVGLSGTSGECSAWNRLTATTIQRLSTAEIQQRSRKPPRMCRKNDQSRRERYETGRRGGPAKRTRIAVSPGSGTRSTPAFSSARRPRAPRHAEHQKRRGRVPNALKSTEYEAKSK